MTILMAHHPIPCKVRLRRKYRKTRIPCLSAGKVRCESGAVPHLSPTTKATKATGASRERAFGKVWRVGRLGSQNILSAVDRDAAVGFVTERHEDAE